MLEFLTGVFIILLSIFFLFISSNKQIEYKKNELNNKIVQEENINKNTDIVADVSDGEKKSGEINKDIINSEENKSNKNIDSKDKGDNKENISIEKQDTNQKNLEDKKNQEKIEFRKKEMMTKLGFIEESYLNIEKKDDKSFEIFLQKAIKIKKELEEKKAQEEKARKQALLEQEKAKQEQIKKELEAKKAKEQETKKQTQNNDNINFSKYVSLKKSTKDKFQVFIYKNGKIEEKWISRNLSPIKQTINLVLKNSGVSLKGVILKNGTLTIKVDNKNNLNEVLVQELVNTAKFFSQVKNVVIK